MSPEELEKIRERTRGPWNPSGRTHRADADALLEEVDRLRDFIDSLTNDPVHGLSAKLTLRGES